MVNYLDCMRAGLSFGNNNIVAVCTRSYWNAVSVQDQYPTIIHELGHQLGMVANGMGILPDKTTYHYDDSKGHRGNHCHFGIPSGQLRYDARADQQSALCVMYGAINKWSIFCDECAKALRKVDLKDGVK